MLKGLFYICVFTLSLGQLSVLQRGGESNIYLFDIFVSAFFLTGLIYFGLVRKKLELPRIFMPFVLFSIIAALSLILKVYKYNGNELLISAFYLFRWFAYLSAGVVVANLVKAKLLTKENVRNAFVMAGVLLTILGFIQLVILPDFEVLDPSLGWDPHKNRLASTFFDPNFLGAYFVMCISLLITKFDKYKKLSWGDIISLLLLITGLILTFSRSSWFMISIVVFLYGALRSRYLLLFSLLLMFGAYYSIPRIQTRISGITDPADSAHFRLISWSNSLHIIKDNLLTGVGFNTYRYVQKEYGYLDFDTYLDHSGAGTDSSLLFVLATTGIFGLLFYVWGFLQPVINYVLNKQKDFLLLFLLTLALFVESQFINSLFYPQIMFFYFSLLASYSFVRT